MPITDEHVAALRAQLTGNRDEHLRLIGQLDPDEANVSYTALVAAAFIQAAERRFINDGKVAENSEVIDFVAQVRETDDESSRLIDPRIAESMILDLLGRGSMVDADPDTRFGHQIVLLAALVGEERYSSVELDEFLEKARSLADELLT
ncbi:hypothetical protein SAMN05443665_100481 [Actinomadura meyerae]|jgi:hypothetical protein|uniref:Uncharacterized protein n=1 Tax=Actinomadura meyerae TaxID=240840 RepID=A0A239EJ65_9ACTN|nr:hypothetical protein [Actinomadura meyerae]SNS44619.1 hypothetical protein SAMN05443665_100481 [Actinomadura meyerae]